MRERASERASDSKGNIQMRCAAALVNSPLSKSIEKYDAEMGDKVVSDRNKMFSLVITEI